MSRIKKAGNTKDRPASNPPHIPPRAYPKIMASCGPGAPGSIFTSDNPSTNRSLETHCCFSWSSACMTAHICPYVTPTFKKLEAMFFQFLSKSASFVVMSASYFTVAEDYRPQEREWL